MTKGFSESVKEFKIEFKDIRKEIKERLKSPFMAGLITSFISFLLAHSVYLSKIIFPKNFPITDLFFNSFGPVFNPVSNLFQNIISFDGLIFIFIFLFMSLFFSLFYIPKRINWWLIITIFIMSILCLFGMLFINDLVGEKEMKSIRLNNCSSVSQKLGEINCENSFSKNVIVGEEVTCNFTKTNFIFSNGSVNFILADGSEQSVNLTDEVKFVVPENLARTTFKLNGTLDNKQTCLSTGFNARYPHYDEFIEDKNAFIRYVGILIVFLLVSVPTSIIKLKKLIERNGEREKTKQTTLN